MTLEARVDVAMDPARTVAEVDRLRNERDAALRRVDAVQKTVDARVDARVELVIQARSILGAGYRVDGHTDHDLRVAVLRKLDRAFDPTGKTEDFVAGQFAHAVHADAVADESLSRLRADCASVLASDGDFSPLRNAIRAHDEAAATAWKR